MSEVLVDTSAWIDFLRHATGPVGDLVEELIRTDRAVLTGVVLTELLQGLGNKAEAKRLEHLFRVLRFIEVERADWQGAGEQLGSLRRQGITLPLTDALIATVARRSSLPVLTLDSHFEHLSAERFPVPGP